MAKKKKVRTPIPAEIEREVKVEAGFRCSMPRCGITSGLEIHHIDEDPSNHDPANLLLLCAVCHARVTKKEIDRQDCRMIKQRLAMLPATREDLERMYGKISSDIKSVVGSQPVARPLVEAEKATRNPDPMTDVAVDQAVILNKAEIPLPVEILRSLAHRLYETGEFEAALGIQRMVMAAPKATAMDWNNLGILLDATGRKDEAEEAYGKAIELEPKDASAYYNLGILLKKTGRKEDAEETYRKAIELEPKDADTWINLGILLHETGRKDEAEEAYRKAIDADPKHASAWYNLGILLDVTGRKDEAKETYRKAIELEPKDASTWYNLGILLDVTGRKDEAEEAYRKAIDADPKHASAWYNLGILLDVTGRKDEAEEAYRKAIDADPKDASAWSDLGALLNEAKRNEEAVEAYRKAAELQPDSADRRNVLAYYLWQIGKPAEAEVEAREALRLDSECSYALATLGLLLFEKDELAKGRTEYERAVELRPDDMPLRQKFHYEYGRALARNKRNVEAHQELDAALQVDSDYIPREQIETELGKL